MKKITKKEDFIVGVNKELDVQDVQDRRIDGYISNGKMLETHLVFPYDNPAKGQFGCVAVEKENVKNELEYISQVYDPCEMVVCNNGEEFFEQMEDSLECNYPTFRCDDPKTLRIGFISMRNNGNKCYMLSLSSYKRYLEL